jgi:hypothetical protein
VASEERLNQRKTHAELRARIAAARTSLIASLPCLSVRLYATSCEVKTVGHFPEGPQDYGILELAHFGTSQPREGPSDENVRRELCINPSATGTRGQPVRTVYIDARSARMHENFGVLALEALRAAWLCR